MEVTGRKKMILCKPCEDDTKRVPANGLCLECEEHMCIACFGNHKKYKICKDHKMVDIDANIPDINDTKEDSFDYCLQHKKEHLKFYCSSHEEIGCGDCMILNHKTCKVDYIRDISESFKDSKEFNDIVKHVATCKKEVNKCSTSIHNSKIQVEDIHLGFLADIKSFRDDINVHFDKLEKELVRKANDVKVADNLRIESLQKPCEELEEKLSQISDDIVSKSDEPNKLFVTAIRCKRAIREIEHKRCSIMSNNSINLYCFRRNNKIEDLLKQTELGEVHTMHEENTSGLDSQEYEKAISLQTPLRSSQTNEETISIQDSQEYEKPISLPAMMKPSSINEDNTSIDSREYQKPVSLQTPVRSSQLYEDTISIPDSQDYEELFYEDIPERKTSIKRGSTRRTSWSLFENQLRCENLLMAGEYLSFKANEKGDIGLFIGKKAIKAGTYLEVEIISSDDKGNIAIGFVPKEYSLKQQPGVGRFSVGYHAKDGCIHDEATTGKRLSPPCKVGDVIGVGVSSYLTNVFKTKIEIFFSRNQQKIGSLEINNPSFCKVYPAVGLQSSGDKARVILDAKEGQK